METNNQTSVIIYAPLWKRILSGIFDNLLISTFTFFIMLTVTFSLFDEMSIGILKDFFTNPVTLDSTLGSFNLDFGQIFFLVYFPLLFLCTFIVYSQTLLSSKKHATFGMQLFGLKLYSADMTSPGFYRVFGRVIAALFFKMTYLELVSFFTILFSKKKQSLDDLLCKTVVAQEVK